MSQWEEAHSCPMPTACSRSSTVSPCGSIARLTSSGDGSRARRTGRWLVTQRSSPSYLRRVRKLMVVPSFASRSTVTTLVLPWCGGSHARSRQPYAHFEHDGGRPRRDAAALSTCTTGRCEAFKLRLLTAVNSLLRVSRRCGSLAERWQSRTSRPTQSLVMPDEQEPTALPPVSFANCDVTSTLASYSSPRGRAAAGIRIAPREGCA